MKVVVLRLQSYTDLFFTAVLGREKKFTSGSINRAIVLLAVPMVLELVMESVFVCASLFFVSKLGAAAVSIVGSTESVISFSYSVSIGLSIAASTLIARRVGEQNFKDASITAGQVINISVICGILISIICFIWSNEILGLVGLSPAVIEQGSLYAN